MCLCVWVSTYLHVYHGYGYIPTYIYTYILRISECIYYSGDYNHTSLQKRSTLNTNTFSILSFNRKKGFINGI